MRTRIDIYMYKGKSLQLTCSCISVSTSENVDIASTFVLSFYGTDGFANESCIIFLTRLLARIWCWISGRKFGDWYTTQKDTALCAPRFAHLELSYEIVDGDFERACDSTWCRSHWSSRRWAQAEAFPLHSGWADACDSPKCGLLGHVIFKCGGLRLR